MDETAVSLPGLEDLFARYRRILVLDTETTGLDPERDETIQLCCFIVEKRSGVPTVVQVYNELIQLPPGHHVPPFITELTGITDYDLNTRGISRSRACRDIRDMLEERALLVAYNAHFDLSFLYHLLRRCGDPGVLQGHGKLDLLTVCRDRRSAPHRLADAIAAYGLTQDRNSHRAQEDTLAAYHLLLAFAGEKDDLLRYVDLFGYNPKYGRPKHPIGSAVYCSQSGLTGRALYEMADTLPPTPPERESFRLGDFLEMFAADERYAAREINWSLLRTEEDKT